MVGSRISSVGLGALARRTCTASATSASTSASIAVEPRLAEALLERASFARGADGSRFLCSSSSAWRAVLGRGRSSSGRGSGRCAPRPASAALCSRARSTASPMRSLDLEHVVGEEAVAVHAVAERLERHVLHRHRARERRAHRVLVVLADEDDRQLPQRGEATAPRGSRRCSPRPRRRSTSVTRPSPRYLRREGDAGRERDVPADDAVAAEHVVLLVEHVHRPAEALASSPSTLPKSSAMSARGAHPLGEGDAVVAVGRDHVVVRPERGDGADARPASCPM